MALECPEASVESVRFISSDQAFSWMCERLACPRSTWWGTGSCVCVCVCV